MLTNSVQDLKFGLNCGIAVNRPWDCLHRHDEIELTFFRTPDPVIYRIGGKVFEIRQADTLIFWGSIPHQLVEIGKGVEQYWLTVPPELFLQWGLPDSMTREILNGKVLTENDEELRAFDLAAFPLWIKEAESARREDRIPLTLSLQARFRRFGASGGGISPPRGFVPARLATKDSSSFFRMYDFITHNYTGPIKVKEIAEAADLNPNYAVTLFHTKCGTHISDFIMMLRVYEAQRLLLTTDMKIIDIAMDAGFGSMSNFYKCFKRFCRKNPKDYRKDLESD
jgi:AraC-like DNA-binding protein